MKSLWCERVVILLLPVLAIGIETPRRRVSIRPADDARICCPFQGDSRVFGREAAGGDWTIRLEWRFWGGARTLPILPLWGRGTMRSMVEGPARCFLSFIRNAAPPVPLHHLRWRSEERRVGKVCVRPF